MRDRNAATSRSARQRSRGVGPATIAAPRSQADEALYRALRVQPSATASAPVPGENLLARAIAELADAASGAMGAGPAVGTLTYTSADGHTVSVPVDVYAERQIARELYEAAQDARALRALANGRVAGNVRTVVAAAANSSRRPLTVIAGGAS